MPAPASSLLTAPARGRCKSNLNDIDPLRRRVPMVMPAQGQEVAHERLEVEASCGALDTGTPTNVSVILRGDWDGWLMSRPAPSAMQGDGAGDDLQTPAGAGLELAVSEDLHLAAQQLSGYLGCARRAEALATELADVLQRRAAL